MTLIKDLIQIPEVVHTGDFVLKLTEGVTKPEQTVEDYVVTDQLERCFDNALTFIRSALDSNTSKAGWRTSGGDQKLKSNRARVITATVVSTTSNGRPDRSMMVRFFRSSSCPSICRMTQPTVWLWSTGAASSSKWSHKSGFRSACLNGRSRKS